jgi:hypothetical protein
VRGRRRTRLRELRHPLELEGGDVGVEASVEGSHSGGEDLGGHGGGDECEGEVKNNAIILLLKEWREKPRVAKESRI